MRVETVFVKVAVADSLNRYVNGLKKEYFKIFEDKVQQNIIHFSQESAPISLGIVFDVSGSMANSLRAGKSWFSQLMKTGNWNPGDEYFLITFNHVITLDEEFTKEKSELEYDMALRKSGGFTALYDAVYRGIDKMKEGKNEKKAIIVITDGGENSSRYSYGEIREFARESDVQIYVIGVGDHNILESLARLTGGRVFFPESNMTGLDYYFNLIHSELRSQYLLGYVPTNDAHDGKWRRIRVIMDTPRGYPALKIRTREGYFASRN